ncbi:MAG TPA: NusG domain II-containing protein [Clostridia bacterium]|nr:NusG domain II-containing protein [Clostridia bacterium]
MKFAAKRDLIIVGVIAVIGFLLWFLVNGTERKAGAYAEIYYRSQLVKTVSLSEGKEESFSIGELPNVVFHLYGDGSIAFIGSDCPDKICIRSGKLHLAGQTAACLPNEVYIKIVSAQKDPDAPDLVAG